ncbi:MAG: thiol peroxidase [Candidatus Cloacimonetes bacterium]|nr:thiol peroxidase [Candidatus Cloacimonadota bacterium]MDD4156579.1 thiol peroxidase [Candidatus Cloacimonadota bacterium]
MAQIKLKGNPINTNGDLPKINSIAPNFTLTAQDLSEISLKEYFGKKIILNIFPSIDTQVCATSVRKFNAESSNLDNTVVLCISADLPFAHSRFCGAEGLNNVITLSNFRDNDFANKYACEIIDGPMKGLLSRAIIIINEQGKVIYTEQVSDIVLEPDYEKALEALKEN